MRINFFEATKQTACIFSKGEETGYNYYGARYLDPKYSRWLSGDPALGDYIPKAPIDDEAKKHNENLPGMGGVFNVVNLHLYHYAGNNPIKYEDPNGKADNDRISAAVQANLRFTSTDSMACDVFVTTVLEDANAKPNDWPDPCATTVKGYREHYHKDLKTIASAGWNVVIMISDSPTMEIDGIDVYTDETPHMGLMHKDAETGELTLVHYTHGLVRLQNFKNEVDFKEKMPWEVYTYDTAEYKPID